jgi:hypothetical protein
VCEEQKLISQKMSEDAIKLNDLSDDRKNLVGTTSSTKIQIVPAQPKTLTHLPSRPPVELAFKDLTYRVKEGRSNSEYSSSLSSITSNCPGWFKVHATSELVTELEFTDLLTTYLNPVIYARVTDDSAKQQLRENLKIISYHCRGRFFSINSRVLFLRIFSQQLHIELQTR